PEEIWQTTLNMCQDAIKQAKILANDIAAIGISNQRETSIVWERATGKPIYNAIVWQDRRTATYCEQMHTPEIAQLIQEKTGLLLDPYFSATKLNWILDNVAGAREQADQGKLCFGTIDTFLLWRLTSGAQHKTDATNAARTLLFNISTQQWDSDLLKLFTIPEKMLPSVEDSSADFGITSKDLLGAEIPITGIAGDQQAALFGQTCFAPGMIKSTYGTGCFLMMNTGDKIVHSKNRLLSTIAYRLEGKVTYAIEGSIFVAGAAVQWLRDTVHLVSDAQQTEQLAEKANPNSKVYLVPAFTGLGAPYWDPNARGAILGLTRDSGIAEIVKAALQAVCYQTNDLMQAMMADGAQAPAALRVDGGMVKNDWLMQFLSDLLNVAVDRPVISETSVLGAVYLAGLRVGIFKSLEHLTQLWQCEHHFTPQMAEAERIELYKGWQQAVKRVLT
ncbi:MAG: glycerol kinase, partial [Gammaproteobacteria bacterium]|nr:glycerol kinase [Gammaproteobacteria bacterium]